MTYKCIVIHSMAVVNGIPRFRELPSARRDDFQVAARQPKFRICFVIIGNHTATEGCCAAPFQGWRVIHNPLQSSARFSRQPSSCYLQWEGQGRSFSEWGRHRWAESRTAKFGIPSPHALWPRIIQHRIPRRAAAPSGITIGRRSTSAGLRGNSRSLGVNKE